MQPSLPIESVLSDIATALRNSSQLLLHAEPGAGKTTRVPLALLEQPWRSGRQILVLEPRRLAAMSAAEYMSSLLKESVGTRVGYRTRGATKVSALTQIEVVTEGILTRLLLEDPALADYAAILFDEFHERSTHTDLGLAFALESQGSLRPDLRLIVMSATLEIEKLRTLLPNAALVSCPGRCFPVEVRYAPPTPRVSLEDSFSELVTLVVKDTEGDILCFLPGKSEIMRVKERLERKAFASSAEILPLAGDLALEEQRRALRPLESGKRKILLATSIAETSLTIDGVRVVVDSGLMRIPRMDYGRGMTELVTVPLSQASATQRSGRAGRQSPGLCYRMWSEFTQRSLAEFNTPEILQADCTPLLLEIAAWGARDLKELPLIDQPQPDAVAQARRALEQLGAINGQGQITTHGKELVSLALHPRFAHMVLASAKRGCGGLACDLAALLEERDILRGGACDIDVGSRWHALDEFRLGRGGTGRRDILSRVDRTSSRLRERLKLREEPSDSSRIGYTLALAFPEWIGRARVDGGANYLLANGSGASLPPGSFLSRNRYLAIAALDGAGANAKIHLAEPLTESDVEELAERMLEKRLSVFWDENSNSVRGLMTECLGSLTLRSRPERPSDEQALSVLVEAIRARGLEILPWSKESLSLKTRLAWARSQGLLSRALPSFHDQWLLAELSTWLSPFLMGVRSIKDLASIDLEQALLASISREDKRELELIAPPYLELPTGTKAWIAYGEQPSISVALQELFGSIKTPVIAGGKFALTIELLSPAKRPLQVTRDLLSFWDNTYPKLRPEMRAKYPRHEWPENPREAPPSKGRKPRKR